MKNERKSERKAFLFRFPFNLSKVEAPVVGSPHNSGQGFALVCELYSPHDATLQRAVTSYI